LSSIDPKVIKNGALGYGIANLKLPHAQLSVAGVGDYLVVKRKLRAIPGSRASVKTKNDTNGLR
jgi:hypothetical protein